MVIERGTDANKRYPRSQPLTLVLRPCFRTEWRGKCQDQDCSVDRQRKDADEEYVPPLPRFVCASTIADLLFRPCAQYPL